VCAVEIESTLIHCVAGRPGDCTALITTRPFPVPHHTISHVELIGGGHIPMLGEVSLAHHGMLFLGELPELRRHVLASLCEPIEKGFPTIAPRHM
jgi:magnesium chelatase family protein